QLDRDAKTLEPAVLERYLNLWVRAGLLEFWLRALPEDATVVRLLRQEIAALSAALAWPQDWQAQCALAQEQLHAAPGFALTRLRDDLDLSLGDLFILCLAGTCQTSHLVNLALAELHAPARPLRLTVHLADSLSDALFGAQPALADSPLLQLGALRLLGEAPLPLRELELDHVLWANLCGRATPWPGGTVLPVKEESTLARQSLAQLPQLAALLSGSGRLRINGVVVRGYPNSGRRDFAARLAAMLHLQALEVPLELWQQPGLRLACRYGGWLPVLAPRLGPGEACRLPPHDGAQPLVVIMGGDGAVEAPQLTEIELQVPDEAERERLCASVLENPGLARQLANQALLSGASLLAIADSAKVLARRENAALGAQHILEARRRLGAEKLRVLAQPVLRQVTREALVLPAQVMSGLDNVIARAHKRESLWRGLGKTLQVSANPGVRVLFVGESGTGKTLAASYIATALGAPLYRVDLSAVMNKYIGESEKNLSQLLDHAAANDVVLLFDEADSLFGSRGDGGDNGERFANMLTNFLLTRIESYSGIAILTTNSGERIDDAFSRRIDVSVEFPLPGVEERLHLWRTHLGERGPGDAVYRHLASHCQFAGGQIRNAVIAAAVFASGERITADDLYRGLQLEYRKIGRDMPPKIERLFAA
ncbi:MAG TPA: ATP-binding protein, partial [Hyphomicrobiales bacterium]|nr:ATP-binding protein [Hyphomicrobiales bacterium]